MRDPCRDEIASNVQRAEQSIQAAQAIQIAAEFLSAVKFLLQR